jgi:hypothetical protein
MYIDSFFAWSSFDIFSLADIVRMLVGGYIVHPNGNTGLSNTKLLAAKQSCHMCASVQECTCTRGYEPSTAAIRDTETHLPALKYIYIYIHLHMPI